MPLIVVEEDRVLRVAQVILDPSTSAERVAAFADYNSTDQPDFAGWLDALRGRLPGLYPADLRLVNSQEELRAALPQADAVVVESLDIGEAELAMAPRLAIVHKFGRLGDNIDQAACAARGIPVMSLRRRTNIAVAEHTITLILALARRLPLINGLVSESRLQQAGFAFRAYDRRHTAAANYGRIPDLRTLHGLTLGLLGLGEIAREVAMLARAFGMRVCYHKRMPLDAAEEQVLGVTHCGFYELFEQSDFLSVHVPSSAKTRSLVDAAAIGRMRRGAYLVNTARAEIVDHDALVEALRAGHLAGAGFDVQYGEPSADDDPLLHFDNVILTPHMAGASRMNGLIDAENLLLNLHAALQRRG
ncbi:NAD(P)-dependent oxidoreductase [Pigmentiphaga sp.]|uniref:2-hydroxyacid dehydrogenase n=1 Tax=Pigmentiphaga sp. TaxID=1977564 RepID=UPI00128C5AC6|nr:NAD(P)-dependent oxidoreductase [Pigmentiphaga sp.]MPS29721.1 D-glycerate dehydrogenase [Alcaligenaceae bacterium SAGV5]MPS54913.1 D-glycerate dehydrogenase [Alcaligenaceae bacterium SAGV3]MPT59184.1 D-glycerate dehydrogenase [Alcaligenaceae bacterium]